MRHMPKRPHGTGHVYVKWASYYGRWRSLDGRLLNRRIGKIRARGSSEGLSRREAEHALRKLVEAESVSRAAKPTGPSKTVNDAAQALRDRLALEGARLGIGDVDASPPGSNCVA